MNKLILLVSIVFFIGLASAQFDYYDVDSSVIEAVVSAGESVTVPITIYGRGDSIDVNLESFSRGGFISVFPSTVNLDGFEERTVNVVLDSSNLEEGVYVGYLGLIGGEFSRIPVILEVQTPPRSLWFDVAVESTTGKVSLLPGKENLDLNIRVFNLGSNSPDVSVRYAMIGLDGTIYYEDSQPLFVRDSLEFSKSISVPGGLDSGDYVFYAVISGDGSFGTDSVIVNVRDEVLTEPVKERRTYWFFLILTFLAISFLVLSYLWDRRVKTVARDWNQKVVDLKKIKFSDVAKEIHGLEYKLKLLDVAYKKKYIKKKSYIESKKGINLLISKLKKRL